MQAYPAYTAEALDRLPYHRFWKLCPPLSHLAAASPEDLRARQRQTVTRMREWKAERARRLSQAR